MVLEMPDTIPIVIGQFEATEGDFLELFDQAMNVAQLSDVLIIVLHPDNAHLERWLRVDQAPKSSPDVRLVLTCYDVKMGWQD